MFDETNRPTARIGRRIGSDIRISLPAENEDRHHCRCFKATEELASAKQKLEKVGFKPQIFEDDHGQVFGLALRLEEYQQIHIKFMSDGEIEAEIEPPPSYPGAHLNSEYCYSAHQELEQVLQYAKISYGRKRLTPITCIRREIKKPEKPTHIGTIVLGVALAIAFVGVFVAIAKGSRG